MVPNTSLTGHGVPSLKMCWSDVSMRSGAAVKAARDDAILIDFAITHYRKGLPYGKGGREGDINTQVMVNMVVI
jgi:hypothetical protein